MKLTILTSFLLLAQITVNAQTQSEMNMQSAAEAKKADTEMTKAYKQAMANQDEKGKKLLLEAHRAWIKYKEAHCKSVSNALEGGSAYALEYNSCITELTKARTKELYSLSEDWD